MTDAPTPGGAPPPPQFQFRIGDVVLLCPATAVEAVTSFTAPVPLPRVPRHVLGLVTYDQRALVLLDLACFLELPACEDPNEHRARTLVVKTGPYRVGLPVEAALGVVTPEAHSLEQGTDLFTGRLAEFAVAEMKTEAGVGAVLDLERLLEAARA